MNSHANETQVPAVARNIMVRGNGITEVHHKQERDEEYLRPHGARWCVLVPLACQEMWNKVRRNLTHFLCCCLRCNRSLRRLYRLCFYILSRLDLICVLPLCGWPAEWMCAAKGNE